MSERWIDALEAVDGARLAVCDEIERLTYDELREQAKRHAGGLQAKFGTGSPLLVRAESSVGFVRALLAIMWSGNIPVPIDTTLPPSARRHITDKSRAAGIVEPLGIPEPGLPPLNHYNPAQPALIVFTSGTSGFPKGVVVSDDNLRFSCHAIAEYLDYQSQRSAAVALPLHYSYALISQLLCQLSIGGSIRIFSDLRNPLKFAATVNREALRTFCGVPSTYHALVMFHALKALSMPSVHVLCSAGAAMEASQFRAVREIFPNARFFNNYGMTEASPRIAYIRDDDPRFEEATCGRPMKGVDVRIIDPETERELSDGERGMLVVRGPNVTSGYLNDLDQTTRAFTADGFLKSGDMAYVDDGYIFILGRYDDVFNSGGEKIAPLEIERVLNDCPGVALSAVIGAPDPQRGFVPVAFVKTSRDITRREIVCFLNEHLTQSKIPHRYYRVSDLPMTANGKLQRNRLSTSDDRYVTGELR